MMRSWARATRAPIAIFHSNRAVMYSVTRIKKTMSPVSIFLEIVLPNVGPTSCSLMSLGEIPAARASSARSWSPRSVAAGRDVAVGVGVGVETDGGAVGLGGALAVGLDEA